MTSAFGGQRSIQLSYGRIVCALSRIPLGGKRPARKPAPTVRSRWRLDERPPMPQCATFAAQEERLARFRFPSARRRGLIRVPGRLRPRRGGRTGQVRERRSGRPDPGLSDQAEGSGPFSGRRPPAHLPRPAEQSAPRSASGSRLGAMSPCSSTTLRRAASRRPAPSTSSKPCPTPMALWPISPAFLTSTPPGSRRSDFLKGATRRSRSRPAARAGFKAAAAFYAPCANVAGATLDIPTLILVGAKDEVTPAADCARAGEAAGARHGEVRDLSRRGPRL